MAVHRLPVILPPRGVAGVLAAMLVAATASLPALAAEARRTNVLFIAVDDLRPEFGAYGSRLVKSPHLDALAAKGVVFHRAYCQQAVCSPSRSSLLTGARPDTTKVYDLVTHFRTAMPDVVTLPQLFKQSGYVVQGMGKLFHAGYDDPRSWSVPWQKPDAPRYAVPSHQALDATFAAEEARRDRAAARRSAGEAGHPKPATRANTRGPAYESADVADSAYHDGELADMAIEALRTLAAGQEPFWLGVGFICPHLPFVAPRRYWDLYDREAIPLADNQFRPKGSPGYAIVPPGELRAYRDIPGGQISEDLARTLKHGYYAALSYMDAQLGRVVAELERLGLADSTIVVVWGDHGWKLGEHDAWCKHSNMELDTRSPLIVCVPGMRHAGESTEALVEFVDIYPTLAELCGLPLPKHLEGTSFVPVLDDPGRAWKSAAFSQYPRNVRGKRLMGYSMRTDSYRLTRWVDRDDPMQVDAVELFDEQEDPQENTNVATNPARASVLADLTAQWHRGWQAAGPRP